MELYLAMTAGFVVGVTFTVVFMAIMDGVSV